jgi:hypothetical protein
MMLKNPYVNIGMPECRRKVSPVVNFFNPASAFRHQGQSGTFGHGLVRHCPVMQRESHIQKLLKNRGIEEAHLREKKGGKYYKNPR